MPDPTISFSCPACGIRLTVPANLAGIKGPCPSCRVEIQAPEVTPESIGRLEIQSPRMHPIVTRAEPHEPLNHPRLAKNKINRDSLSDDENPVRGSTHESPRPATARSGYSRYFLPSLLLIFLVALACGAWSFFQKSRSRDLVKQTPTPKIEISPEQNQPLESVQDIDIPPPTSPPLPIDGFAQSLPSVIEAKTPPSVTMSAREVLDQFLTAKSLPERRSILETQTSESELANSCLAAPLPVATHIEIEIKETNSLEQVTNTYYGVDFSKENESSQTHTILVRARGKSEPKIIVDPFLDTYGGRLVDYSTQPSDQSGTFKVIVSAMASCDNPQIPRNETKLTLKLLARDNTQEIARAHFSKSSSIGKSLEDGSYRLSYGRARPCTVTLKWNTEEDPRIPFLEVIELDTSGWNP